MEPSSALAALLPALPPLPAQRLDPRRLENVGASEVGALFSITWDEQVHGDRPRETRLQLWWRKVNRLEHESDSAEALYWGNVLESTIAAGLAGRFRFLVVRPGFFVTHPQVRGMSASLDFTADFAPMALPLLRNVPLEVKNVGHHAYLRWQERTEQGVWEWSEGDQQWYLAERQPPLSMKLQVLHQMACHRSPAGLLGALVGGNSGRLFRIDWHRAMVGRIEEEVAAFWRSVDANDPPAPNWSLDAETIGLLYGEPVPGLVADLRGNPAATAALRSYFEARDQEAAGKERKATAKGQLLFLADQAMGAAASRIVTDIGHVACGQVGEAPIRPKKDTRSAYRNFQAYEAKTPR